MPSGMRVRDERLRMGQTDSERARLIDHPSALGPNRDMFFFLGHRREV